MVITMVKYGDGSKPWYLVNPKIAGKWMFIPLKMVLIGIDPYTYIHSKTGTTAYFEKGHFRQLPVRSFPSLSASSAKA